MKQEFTCKICGESMGTGHGYQQATITELHFRQQHPNAYRIIAQLNDQIRRTEQEFGIYARDFFKFREDRLP